MATQEEAFPSPVNIPSPLPLETTPGATTVVRNRPVGTSTTDATKRRRDGESDVDKRESENAAKKRRKIQGERDTSESTEAPSVPDVNMEVDPPNRSNGGKQATRRKPTAPARKNSAVPSDEVNYS